MPARFNIRSAQEPVIEKLCQDLGVPRFIAATLAARGIDTPQAAHEFLNPSLERDWPDPYEIFGLKEAVDTLETAIRNKKHIVVFGDFDLDGISSTAVLTRALNTIGLTRVTPFIPRRFEEGYALTPLSIKRVKECEPDLIITVDCGISCKEEVAALCAEGIEVVITDHHEPADLVPENVPICNPKCGEGPGDILAGVGVALSVVQALGARFGKPHLWREYTDLATLGTIADLMPMRGGNRALVADGVARINSNPRPCIAALLEQTGTLGRDVAAHNLSFSVIPRLNAAGRMGDAERALDLLLVDDFVEAQKRAAELEEINNHRRSIEAELTELAREQAEQSYHDQRVLVVAGRGWHEGVKGIVASRLVNAYGVPALLFTIEGDEARGSGRSIGQINLFKAVESCADLLTRFGGHEAAVGLTLPADNLGKFTERLTAYMDTLDPQCFHPSVSVDACVQLEELSLENVAQLSLLEPFGQENPVPRYLARGVLLSRCRAVGADKNHFSCVLTDGRSSVSAIMFHCSEIANLMHCGSVVNAAFEVQIDEWRGRRSVKAMISSLAPVEPCAALEACLSSESVSFVSDLYKVSDRDLCADCCEDAQAVQALEARLEQNRACWQQRAHSEPHALQEAIVKNFLGERNLHEAQRKVLEALGQKQSSLGIMATGRGKSLTFQVYATYLALREQKLSIFVYPLRALIADQAFHLSHALEEFGVQAVVLTGESTAKQRELVNLGMQDGSIDIVLTTPEYLHFHADDFAACGRVGFVVIDEAHHIAQAKTGNRSAYLRLSEALERLGNPLTLALTATAGDEIAQAIQETLHIRKVIVDPTSRPNLELADERNLKTRENYLANLVAGGKKTVIYVNSREQAVLLARNLRKQVPHLSSLIGFYHAGLSRQERIRIEELFRTDALCVLIATAAFGEGVNIGNIRHVVLYHLPFNEVELNQMAGRAGRDGQPACIHLLFGGDDALTNKNILSAATPDHDGMAQIYRAMRRLQNTHDGCFTVTEGDLALEANKQPFRSSLIPASIACGIAVFSELGLLEAHRHFEAGRALVTLRLVNTDSKVELSDSVRYREGLDEREIFNEFREWVMSASSDEIRERLIHPITPDKTGGER